MYFRDSEAHRIVLHCSIACAGLPTPSLPCGATDSLYMQQGAPPARVQSSQPVAQLPAPPQVPALWRMRRTEYTGPPGSHVRWPMTNTTHRFTQLNVREEHLCFRDSEAIATAEPRVVLRCVMQASVDADICSL